MLHAESSKGGFSSDFSGLTTLKVLGL